MRERGRSVGLRIDDVIGELTLFRIELGQMPDPFGDLVVRARRVSADAEPTSAVTTNAIVSAKTIADTLNINHQS